MKRIFRCLSYIFLACGSVGIPSLVNATEEVHTMDKTVLEASAQASKSWLEIVDKGQYAKSWDDASALMKLTIHQDEWEKAVGVMRKSLGTVSKREIVDQRTAQNPHGLPVGDYMVMFYKTSFTGRSSASELVTLHLEEGQWRVMTYQIN